MSCMCLPIFAATISLLVFLYHYSKVARYYIIVVYFYISMLASGFVASIIGFILNGRSTKNYFYSFPVFYFLIKWLNINVEVRNNEHLETEEPCIIIVNHQSGLDVFTMTKVWPKNCSVILKSSLKYVPIFNFFVYLGDCIFIDRFSKEKSRNSLKDALEKIKNDKRKVFIYPEGTRNVKKELLPFKKGAFILSKESNIPVVPVVFSRYEHFMNHNQRKWDINGKIIIKVLPPVDPREFPDVDAMAKECRTRMQNELNDLDKELSQKA